MKTINSAEIQIRDIVLSNIDLPINTPIIKKQYSVQLTHPHIIVKDIVIGYYKTTVDVLNKIQLNDNSIIDASDCFVKLNVHLT